MIGRITIKRIVKRTAGGCTVLAKPFASQSTLPQACIFFYHRIADVGFVDPKFEDWNVSPDLFEKQIAALADFAEFVPLLELPGRLKRSSASAKPLVCLTFDDGYANFYSQALPILERYHAPATLFVITSLVGRREPVPFDRWSQRNRIRLSSEAWRPINWAELEACLASELVTLGAHSHKHLKGHECTPNQLIEEAEESREILKRRFGDAHALAYSYPYGSTQLGDVSPEYVRAVQTAGYRLAVTTDLGLARSDGDPYRLPRIEAHSLDVSATLQAKALGALGPYFLADRLRLFVAKRAV
jgi:peptidoglycan/xylan/chitin deacetylase (PgdA/CDA1 family)